MEPTTLALASQAATPLLGALGARQAAEAQADQANLNAFIARTRGMQQDTVHRQTLEDDLGNMRATFAANGQRPNVGTFEMFRDFRKTRSRERRIDYGNRMMEAANFRQQASNARAQGRMALPLGLAKAAPSIFDLYQVWGT